MRMQKLAAAAVTAMLMSGAAAHATIINVDFDGVHTEDTPPVGDANTYVGVGAVGSPSDTFNNGVLIESAGNDAQTFTSDALKDSLGNATGAKVEVGIGGGDYNVYLTPTPFLLQVDYFFNSAPGTFVVSGLLGPSVDLYLFVSGGSTVTFASPANVGIPDVLPRANGAYYTFYNDVPVVGGSITGVIGSAVIYGFTLEGSFAPIPEPTSLAVVGLALPLIMRRRH